MISIPNPNQYKTQSNQNNTLQSNLDEHQTNIILLTRNFVKNMTQIQQFQKAKSHLQDAYYIRAPKPQLLVNHYSFIIKIVQYLNSSHLYLSLLYIISYVFMFLIIFQSQQSFQARIITQWILLGIFILDIISQIIYKSQITISIKSKYQKKFYLRVLIITLLVIDQIILSSTYKNNTRLIIPFRILRCTLPLFYDSLLRKLFQSLILSYRNLFVLLFFQIMVILGFAVIGNKLIDVPPGSTFDQFRQNYGDFGKIIFIIYVLSTYDSYPDNQIFALNINLSYYAFFITFVLFNFFSVAIPATQIFNAFRQVRSQILLTDQLKQQNSLILCFVSLGQKNLCISSKKFTKFLMYIYNNNPHYAEYVASICSDVDQNKNQQISLAEFLQLCKVLRSSNIPITPTYFSKWRTFNRIKVCLDYYFCIGTIYSSLLFQIMAPVIVILNFINGCLLLFVKYQVFKILDYIFLGIFCIELIIKILAMGPTNFSNKKSYILDVIIVILALVLTIVSNKPRNSHVLLKMVRIYRFVDLVKITKFGRESESPLLSKFYKLMRTSLTIFPIVIKFFPFIIITFYILSVVGQQAFYISPNVSAESSSYNLYGTYSNFKSFMPTQYIMVQVLTEAGWSFVAFDTAIKVGYYSLVMVYFICCHMSIVIIVSSLIKGVVWEVYSIINTELSSRAEIHHRQLHEEKERQQKMEEIQQVKATIQQDQQFIPNTILKKQIYEQKINQEVYKKLNHLFSNVNHIHKSQRHSTLKYLIDDHQMEFQQVLDRDSIANDQFTMKIISDHIVTSLISQPSHQIVELIQELAAKVSINPNIKFTEVIIYPQEFIQYLSNKLKQPSHHDALLTFDSRCQIFQNSQSLNLYSFELIEFLRIEKTLSQKRFQILKVMVEDKVITQEMGQELFNNLETKELNIKQNIDTQYVIRNVFLADTQDSLIKQFYLSYFSDIYGDTFKAINNISPQSLMNQEAIYIYCLRNLLRYPNYDRQDFFQLLLAIENQITHHLLNVGSVFKFVFQINCNSDTWFTTMFTQNGVSLRFIKSGVWLYHNNLKQSQVNYASDIFNWYPTNTRYREKAEKIMKLFYNSFETLALCLDNLQQFYQQSPKSHIYNLYTTYINNQKLNEPTQKLRVSRVMAVLLETEGQRSQGKHLPYQFYQTIQSSKQARNKFRYDEAEEVTFQKLKHLSSLDEFVHSDQSSIYSYAYLVNFMTEIKDILHLYSPNILTQVQSLLNRQFTTYK